MNEAVIYLSNMLHGRFFDPMAYLADNDALLGEMLRHFRLASIAVFILFFVLEIIRRQMRNISGGQPNMMPFILASILLGVVIGAPGVYLYGCKLIIATGAYVAKVIDNIDSAAVGMEVQNLMRGSLLNTLNPVAFFTAIMEMLNPLAFISVLLYWTATGLLFVMPILQGLFIGLFVVMGPILLPLAIFKPFARVGMVWLYSLLAASFFSVFGVIAYTAISISGILTFIAESQTNVFLSSTYSLVTIFLILCIPKTSFALFEGSYAAITKGVSMTARLLKMF